MKKKKPKRDIGLKIGTKREALWTSVKREAEGLIESHTKSLEIQKEMLRLAESIIKEEQGK